MLIASFMGDQDAHEVWGPRARVQIFKKNFYTYIHLNLIRIELLSCIKKDMRGVWLLVQQIFKFSLELLIIARCT